MLLFHMTLCYSPLCRYNKYSYKNCKKILNLKLPIQPSTVYISILDAQLQKSVSEMKEVVLSVSVLPDTVRKSLSSKETVKEILNHVRMSKLNVK